MFIRPWVLNVERCWDWLALDVLAMAASSPAVSSRLVRELRMLRRIGWAIDLITSDSCLVCLLFIAQSMGEKRLLKQIIE